MMLFFFFFGGGGDSFWFMMLLPSEAPKGLTNPSSPRLPTIDQNNAENERLIGHHYTLIPLDL